MIALKRRSRYGIGVFLVFFWLFPSSVFSLPKEKSPDPGIKAVSPPKQDPARLNPMIYEDFEGEAPQTAVSFSLAPPYLGPSRVDSAASPYIDVRVGIPEFHYNNNHLRTQVGIGPSGAVHMVYEVRTVPGTSADTAINDMGAYNAYDCSGSGELLIDPGNPNRVGLPLQAPGTVADPRLRQGDEPALFIPSGSDRFVAYTRRYILREETPPANDRSFRGHATWRDSAECLGSLSMDTTMINGNTGNFDPVGYALNESTWVATWTGPQVSQVFFNYTTDRGKTWTLPVELAFNTPWLNSTDITGSGNTFYILGMFDPDDPNAFTTTERPGYLKGTYDPLTGTISFGVKTNIVSAAFRQPGFLGNMIDIDGIMVGDTLHVLWTDWNGYDGTPFAGPGGAVWHAAVLPDGTVQGPHKITDINIDGGLPDRSYTLWGFMANNWPNVELVHGNNAENGQPTLYALWSQPPDDGAFGWADYEQYGALGVYDIFCSASPANGRTWDYPQNVTQTNNPGCDGSPGNPCYHEDHFSAAPRVANDTIWIGAMVQAYPGSQELAVASGHSPDPGPFTEDIDRWRLHKLPARKSIPGLRPHLDTPPTDTTLLSSIKLLPRVAAIDVTVRLSNLGFADFSLDSIKLTGTLNDGYLITTINAVSGTFIPAGQTYDFNLTFDPSGVSQNNQGLRSGFLEAYVSATDPSVPPDELKTMVRVPINAYVTLQLCFNRKIQIHSATNRTDVGTQGSIKDQGGNGMFYPFELGFDDVDFFYDGGVWIANSSLSGSYCGTRPRKVSRQIFDDKFLRCVADGILDSVPGTGSYYNLFLKSIGTDLHDTTIVWQNIWEQSTHPDSSDFLIQTTRVINIGDAPVDSVAMGVIYDIDVTSLGIPESRGNVGGDTTISHSGRIWWLGWVTDIDLSIDSCSPSENAYGFMVVPGSIGNPGDTVRPRGAVINKQKYFTYDLACLNPIGGDTLAQRYSWYLDVLASTRDRAYDTLTGVWEDTLGGPPDFICGDRNTGPPFASDMGYTTIAKKVYNLPVNGGGQTIAARYGLEGLAAAVDTFFSGPGETYTVIHVTTPAPGGLGTLMANAVTAADWYVNHSGMHVGPQQTWRKGDLNKDSLLSAADVVEALQFVFLADEFSSNTLIPICAADLNNDGGLTAADVVTLLNGVFIDSGVCPNCLRPCI